MKNQHETPEALAHALFTAAQLAPGEGIEDAVGRLAALVEAHQHARIAELEAQLEAIGAGGVSGPLLGRAAEHFRDATKMMGRWYMVTHDGVATLCEDLRDAEKEAKDADMAWPHSGPHRAVQLVEASMAGYTAADMATASAQGFRDGVASTAPPTAQAEGWRLVPEDATEEMVRATDKVNFANADTDGTMHNVWNVMLAAAPTSAEGVEHG